MSDGWRNFEVQTASSFAVQAHAQGQVRMSDDSVCFKVEEVSLATTLKGSNAIRVVGVTPGLATYSTDKNHFKSLAFAPAKSVAADAPVVGSLKLGPFEAGIAHPPPLPADVWVTMKVQIEIEGRSGEVTVWAREAGRP